MAFCRECGKEIAPGAKFCPECGAPQFAAHPGPAKAEARSEAPSVTRGAGDAKWMSYLGFAAGISIAATGLLFYTVPGAFEFAIGTLFLLTGIAAILFGYGYRLARPWAWALGMITGVLYFLVGFLLAFIIPLAGLASVIFGALAIYQMARRDVKVRLGRGAPA